MKPFCPKCKSEDLVKSGVINARQRYKCKSCAYNFTVSKEGKNTDPYYIIKALQLYIEGISLREIERILGISHVTVRNWVIKYGIKKPISNDYHPAYKILNIKELGEFFSDPVNVKSRGCIVTELGDKYIVIQWERFKKSGF